MRRLAQISSLSIRMGDFTSMYTAIEAFFSYRTWISRMVRRVWAGYRGRGTIARCRKQMEYQDGEIETVFRKILAYGAGRSAG